MQRDIETDSRLEVREVTDIVNESIPANAESAVTVFSRHTTAGVIINEPERRLLRDFESFLEEIVPDGGWRHDQIDDNADSHLRAVVLGESATIPVQDGQVDLGTWQAVLFVECDGPQRRSLEVIVH